MKRVPGLVDEPPGLAQWRAEHPEERNSAKAYRELVQALVLRQQGLCAYCEQRLTSAGEEGGSLIVNDYQVEHVQAKSGGEGRTLDWRNLMLCCGGGTWPHHRDSTRHGRGRRSDFNTSCGQVKNDDDLRSGCDPRSWPWREALVEVGLDGRIRADPSACERAGIDPRDLDDTINNTLGLNNERLRTARQSVVENILGWVVPLLEEMIENSPNIPENVAANVRRELVGGRLRPDVHGHLNRFWTTERCYLGEPAEHWIRDNARLIHFE